MENFWVSYILIPLLILLADIYNIVLKANVETIKSSMPGKTYREVHLEAARIIAGGLKDLGLMKGDVDEAVAAGAHALSEFPSHFTAAVKLDPFHLLQRYGRSLNSKSDPFIWMRPR